MRTLLESGGRPIVLGGDHSISYPVVRAVRWFHPRLSILHFDAHPDLYPEFEGDRFSHACPFARVLEEKLADQLVQVGIRTMNAIQRQQAERFGVDVIDMRAWSAGRRPALRNPVYISIDLDAFDPAFAPGVSHREPGGLTVREVLTVLQGVRVPIVGADVVEFNPELDPSGVTATVRRDRELDDVAGLDGNRLADRVAPATDRVDLDLHLGPIPDQLGLHHQDLLREPGHRAEPDALAAADQVHVHVEKILVVHAERGLGQGVYGLDRSAVTGHGGQAH